MLHKYAFFRFIAVAALCAASGAYGTHIEIGQVMGHAGEEAQVPVAIIGGESAVGVHFRLQYDASRMFSPSVLASPSLLPTDYIVNYYSPGEGMLHCLAYSAGAATPLGSASKIIFHLAFQVKGSVQPNAMAQIVFEPVPGGIPMVPASGLSDRLGKSLAHSRISGYVLVSPARRVKVTGINRTGYEADILSAGKLSYLDRTYIFDRPVPLKLTGETYIRTRNGDKDLTGNSFLTFNIDGDAIIYLSFPASKNQLPDWTAGWHPQPESLVVTDGSRKLLARHFPAGKVTLGANRDSDQPTGPSMYNVIITAPAPAMAAGWMLYE